MIHVLITLVDEMINIISKLGDLVVSGVGWRELEAEGHSWLDRFRSKGQVALWGWWGEVMKSHEWYS